jgi:hypothetical protein
MAIEQEFKKDNFVARKPYVRPALKPESVLAA